MKKKTCVRRMTELSEAVFVFCAGSAGVFGCAGGSNPDGTTRLTAITFSPASEFPQGEDPAEFDVDGGSITASGGTAGTLGQFGLYADDLYAWDFLAGTTGRITFNDLAVVAVDGYWVHPSSQSAGATITVNFSDGSAVTVASVPVSAFGGIGQAAGFFVTITAPEGATITSLTFEFNDNASDGDVAALDVLEFTVPEESG